MGSNLLIIELESIRDSHVTHESLREKKSMAFPTPFVKKPRKNYAYTKKIDLTLYDGFFKQRLGYVTIT